MSLIYFFCFSRRIVDFPRLAPVTQLVNVTRRVSVTWLLHGTRLHYVSGTHLWIAATSRTVLLPSAVDPPLPACLRPGWLYSWAYATVFCIVTGTATSPLALLFGVANTGDADVSTCSRYDGGFSADELVSVARDCACTNSRRRRTCTRTCGRYTMA